MKHLIILRGVPGCGKSTVAEILSDMGMDVEKAPVCTADDFFMKDGEYKFNPKALGIAHKVCQDKCEKAMADGVKRVIVANTSTTEKEIKPYMNMAKKYGYMTFSLIVENRHGGKNEHGVPVEALKKMEERFSFKLSSIPKPPEPPLCRTLREGVGHFCNNCGSTSSKVGFLGLFGERLCDNKKCLNSKSKKTYR